MGFLFGFIIGGGIASLLVKARHDEAVDAVEAPAESQGAASNPVAARIKHQVDEAKDAAREAQLEKEAEMQRMYDEMVHRKPETQP